MLRPAPLLLLLTLAAPSCGGDGSRQGEELFPSGAVRARYTEIEMADGSWVRHGPAQGFHEDGSADFEGEYRDGREHGRWTRRHPAGGPREEGHYRGGVQVGRWTTWHPGGGLESEGSYVDGRKEGVWIHRDAEGALDARRTGVYEDGHRFRDWWEEGQRLETLLTGLQQRAEYRGGLREGPSVSWHADGTKRSEGTFSRGMMTGEWKFWHEDGTPDEDRTGRYEEHVKVSEP